jgi:hypothetical protein
MRRRTRAVRVARLEQRTRLEQARFADRRAPGMSQGVHGGDRQRLSRPFQRFPFLAERQRTFSHEKHDRPKLPPSLSLEVTVRP